MAGKKPYQWPVGDRNAVRLAVLEAMRMRTPDPTNERKAQA
jgi:hypothetical protein